MSTPLSPDGQGSSTRPYLIRALHDWCTDNGLTPYLAVHVDRSVQVPAEFVKNSEIVLNASFEATSGLQLGNEVISFKARFGGTPREIVVPVSHVIAIYARENGQGMAFPAPTQAAPAGMEPLGDEPRGLRLAPVAVPERLAPNSPPEDEPPDGPEPASGGRPSLKRVK
jgi:stringent starvation protein B